MNAPTAAAGTFSKIVKSDELPQLVSLLRHFEPFKAQINFFQLNIILDANVILKELIWICKKRKNPAARSDILELIECSVVRAHAPTFLLSELEIHIPRLAKQQKVDEAAMRVHWERFRARITLIDVGGPAPVSDSTLRDPKDIPYIKLQERLNAPIFSEDKDLPAMGARVIRVELFGPLKAYSRKTAVEYHIKTVGIGSAVLLTIASECLLQGAKSAAGTIARIPKPIIFLGAALIVIAILHPTSRRKIGEVVERMLSGSSEALFLGWQLLEPIVSEHNSSKNDALTELNKALVTLDQSSTSHTASRRS